MTKKKTKLPKGFRLAHFDFKTVVFDIHKRKGKSGTQSPQAKKLTRKLPKSVRKGRYN